jgi:hypothetical protein
MAKRKPHIVELVIVGIESDEPVLTVEQAIAELPPEGKAALDRVAKVLAEASLRPTSVTDEAKPDTHGLYTSFH